MGMLKVLIATLPYSIIYTWLAYDTLDAEHNAGRWNRHSTGRWVLDIAGLDAIRCQMPDPGF